MKMVVGDGWMDENAPGVGHVSGTWPAPVMFLTVAFNRGANWNQIISLVGQMEPTLIG